MCENERGNFSAVDHMQRLEIVEDAAGETQGILIEWGEVRISDSCVQTPLEIQTLTNAMQKLIGGKIERRHTFPGHGRDANLELRNETRYGGLLVNAEVYPCVKRACLSLEEIRRIRLGKMQIKGQ